MAADVLHIGFGVPQLVSVLAEDALLTMPRPVGLPGPGS
jgi:hypothetical protein